MAYDEACFVIDGVNDLLAAGIGGVKQVKRGTVTSWDGTSNKEITTNVTVNVNKTIVILQSNLSGLSAYQTNSSLAFMPVYQSVLRGMSSTTITLSPCYYVKDNSTNVFGVTSWQLIEFY